MAWLQIDWTLSLPDPEEASRGGDPSNDEPRLQFALVTAFSGEVRMHGFSTDNLFPTPSLGTGIIVDPTPDGIVSSKNVPTERNPFFGLAVRAVEEDSSNHRDRDDRDFFNAVRNAAQDTFDADGVPTATVLWRAGSGADLRDPIGDDDDNLGVSARAYPNFGSKLAPHLGSEDSLPAGGAVISAIETFEFRFVRRRNTEYVLTGTVQAVTNDPPPPRLIGDQIER